MICVRAAEPADERAWRRLWAAYLAFYAVDLADEVTDATWTRILDPSSPFVGLIAVRDRLTAGFAVAVLHEGSWTTRSICYLEDLFVDPGMRNEGVGRALITALLDLGRSKGWSRLYWHTRSDNVDARHLYDKFAASDGFVRYRIFLR
jgi:GNAT superfamily N-acetyltransferase